MIKLLDLQKINQQYQPELSEAVKRVIDSGWYLLGNEIKNFEHEFAEYCGVKHGIAVTNGTVALHLALVALGIGSLIFGVSKMFTSSTPYKYAMEQAKSNQDVKLSNGSSIFSIGTFLLENKFFIKSNNPILIILN